MPVIAHTDKLFRFSFIILLSIRVFWFHRLIYFVISNWQIFNDQINIIIPSNEPVPRLIIFPILFARGFKSLLIDTSYEQLTEIHYLPNIKEHCFNDLFTQLLLFEINFAPSSCACSNTYCAQSLTLTVIVPFCFLFAVVAATDNQSACFVSLFSPIGDTCTVINYDPSRWTTR